MKKIDSGYGNSGDLMQARQGALQEKTFLYITITTSGGVPNRIGGTFHYEICGTDLMEELLVPNIIRQNGEIIDVTAGKTIERDWLARQYIESLSAQQKVALIDKMLEAYLTGRRN